MTESQILSLFPTPLGVYSLGEENRDRDSMLVNHILQLQASTPGVVSSNLGGWHSGNLKKDDDAKWLRHHIKDCVYQHLEKCGYVIKVSLAHMWANVNGPGDQNLTHCHKDSVISGVYYPVKYVEAGRMVFNYDEERPVRPGSWSGEGGELTLLSPGYGSNISYGDNINPLSLDKYHVVPKSGTLVLFPSHMLHSVMPFTRDVQRFSIAFNFRHNPWKRN